METKTKWIVAAIVVALVLVVIGFATKDADATIQIPNAPVCHCEQLGGANDALTLVQRIQCQTLNLPLPAVLAHLKNHDLDSRGECTKPSPTPSPKPTDEPRPECRLKGDYVINFDYEKLFANKDVHRATTNISEVKVPAGNYHVTLQSFDSHPDRTSQSQEQWYLLARGAQSNAISDLPDKDSHRREEVGVMKVADTIVNWVGRHAAYENKDPHSVTAVCAALDEWEDEEPEPSPKPSPTPSDEPKDEDDGPGDETDCSDVDAIGVDRYLDDCGPIPSPDPTPAPQKAAVKQVKVEKLQEFPSTGFNFFGLF